MTDTRERLTAALADRYRMERELGAGGMATVFLAHDIKHDRDVAIKVLHPDLGAALGGERFLTEIRTTARLQHPHILPLLDSGEADKLLYYVMPLVTGETLRARLERERQLPVAEAIRIAREVASALDYAHRQGVIHRDIKPENVLLHDGSALVADFGIALAVQQAGGARMTQTGLSLGTPQYMSPEQAMGERSIDARSDIYALGAVLYEMLAGDAPFIGGSVQAIVAKVLNEKPTPLHTLRDTVPEAVEAAVLTALAKLPADRHATAAAFATALEGASTTSMTSGARRVTVDPTRTSMLVRFAPWALAAGLAVALAWQARDSARSAPTSRQMVTLWKQAIASPLDAGASRLGNEAAIAPDGSAIIYTDSTSSGRILMRKARDAAEASPIPGTERGLSPFFSADGKWIGFLTQDGFLRKVPAEGGAGAVTLLKMNSASAYASSAWMADGSIVIYEGGEIARVSSDGALLPAPNVSASGVGTRADRGIDVVALSPLPDARGFLFTICPGSCSVGSSVWAYDAKADSAHLVLPQGLGAWYAPTGHLVYTSRESGLYASLFDLASLQITGGSFSVIDGVIPSKFAFSPSGAALYSIDRIADAPSALVWISRDGRAEQVDSSWRAAFEYPAIGPDGQSLAVSLRGTTTELWIWRSDRSRRRVRSNVELNWRPSWSGDGRSLAFVAIREVNGNEPLNAVPVIARADGTGSAEPLVSDIKSYFEVELSRDGGWVVFRADQTQGSLARLSTLYYRRRSGDTTLRLVPTGDVSALQPALSPDGKWLAFGAGNLVGSREIIVQSFPDAQQRVVVSEEGGSEPRWSGNGRELFFRRGGQMMAVSVSPGPVFSAGPPRALFSVDGYRAARNRPQYDVTPDGQRFLMIRENSASQVVYVENWFTELLAKAKQ